jgi:folylpolyglutamate synthase/dihydrofolate synthase
VAYERYRQAVEYLERRLWHELPIVPVERALQSRVRTLLAHFGDPHLRFPVVHVAGSAGKGSTSAIIASILRAAGLRTGVYASPHLQTFIERIDVDGTLIAPDEFAETVLGLDPLVRKMHLECDRRRRFGRPSLVEVAFAAGMRYFAEQRCDAVVVEAGLGGRTDYSNVFDEKAVTVITNVDFEHRERLGWSLTSIAREKAAIIRGGETVVTGVTAREPLALIEARCARRARRCGAQGATCAYVAAATTGQQRERAHAGDERRSRAAGAGGRAPGVERGAGGGGRGGVRAGDGQGHR